MGTSTADKPFGRKAIAILCASATPHATTDLKMAGRGMPAALRRPSSWSGGGRLVSCRDQQGHHHSCKRLRFRQADEWCMLHLHLLQDSRAASRTCRQVCSPNHPGQTVQPLTMQLQSPGDTEGCEG